MNSILSTVNTVYRAWRQRYGHARTRELLLGKTDRLLDDIGVSRTLLNEGVEAWPWREPDETSRRRASAAETASAVAELARYSDTELADLDISRHGLRDAVEQGRPGYDEDGRRAA